MRINKIICCDERDADHRMYSINVCWIEIQIFLESRELFLFGVAFHVEAPLDSNRFLLTWVWSPEGQGNHM